MDKSPPLVREQQGGFIAIFCDDITEARELGPKGIRVNAVAPGITETDMMKAVPKEVIEPIIERIPLRRLGQPEDIVNAFVFLASDEASYITGVILSVDGIHRIIRKMKMETDS